MSEFSTNQFKIFSFKLNITAYKLSYESMWYFGLNFVLFHYSEIVSESSLSLSAIILTGQCRAQSSCRESILA